MAVETLNEDEQRRFLAKVRVGDGCWEWQATITRAGYGQFAVKRRGLHRASHPRGWRGRHMSGGWTDWLALGLAVAFTLAAATLGVLTSRDDLEAAQHEVELDELWGPDAEWVEP